MELGQGEGFYPSENDQFFSSSLKHFGAPDPMTNMRSIKPTPELFWFIKSLWAGYNWDWLKSCQLFKQVAVSNLCCAARPSPC